MLTTEIKPKDIKKVIADILILRDDFAKIGHKVIPGIAGFYGELIAWEKLRSYFEPKGYTVRFGSGQSKADIVLLKGSEKINVEVKTSRLKDEGFGTGYGFAINIKKCREHSTRSILHHTKGKIYGDFCYFDYLLAVSLADDLRQPHFYVFRSKLLYKNERSLRNKSKHFSSITHRIIFASKIRNSTEITRLDRAFMKRKRIFENAWRSIK